MSELETALEFIQNIEQKNSNKSADEIANVLADHFKVINSIIQQL